MLTIDLGVGTEHLAPDLEVDIDPMLNVGIEEDYSVIQKLNLEYGVLSNAIESLDIASNLITTGNESMGNAVANTTLSILGTSPTDIIGNESMTVGIEGVKDFLSKAYNKAKETAKKIYNYVKNLVKKILNWIKKLLKGKMSSSGGGGSVSSENKAIFKKLFDSLSDEAKAKLKKAYREIVPTVKVKRNELFKPNALTNNLPAIKKIIKQYNGKMYSSILYYYYRLTFVTGSINKIKTAKINNESKENLDKLFSDLKVYIKKYAEIYTSFMKELYTYYSDKTDFNDATVRAYKGMNEYIDANKIYSSLLYKDTIDYTSSIIIVDLFLSNKNNNKVLNTNIRALPDIYDTAINIQSLDDKIFDVPDASSGFGNNQNTNNDEGQEEEIEDDSTPLDDDGDDTDKDTIIIEEHEKQLEEINKLLEKYKSTTTIIGMYPEVLLNEAAVFSKNLYEQDNYIQKSAEETNEFISLLITSMNEAYENDDLDTMKEISSIAGKILPDGLPDNIKKQIDELKAIIAKKGS